MVNALGDDSEIVITNIKSRFKKSSSGERVLIMAILYASDYCHLADEMAKRARVTFLGMMQYTGGELKAATLACLARLI